MAGEAATLTFADGREQRLGPDEPDPQNVPSAISFDTEMPGGFGPGSITLPRTDFPDALPGLYTSTRIYDLETNETLHEGRISSVDKGPQAVTLQIEGWSKHLEDNKTKKWLFVDRDFSKWRNASVKRKIFCLTNGLTPQDGSTSEDPYDLQPGLDTSITGPWSASLSPYGGSPITQMYYDGGVDIGSIYYAWKAPNTSAASSAWTLEVRLITGLDDVGGASDLTGNLMPAPAGSTPGPGAGTLNASIAGKRMAMVYFYYGSNTAHAGTEIYTMRWTCLAVYGNHGITKQAGGTAVSPNGLLGSDCLAYAVAQGAPLLKYSTGPTGSIEPTTFPITHLVFDDAGDTRRVVDAVSLFGGSSTFLNDWGVYDNRTFFSKTPGTYGRKWRVRKDQAVESQDDGADAAELMNGVLVQYDDGTGTTKTVGPTGSGADTETAQLLDTSTSNPANNDGARHWVMYDAGIQSLAGATLIGQLILYNATNLKWRGSINIKQWAYDEAGNRFPCGLMRAGDTVVVEDDDDTAPRRIGNTSYSAAAVSCSVGAQPNRLDVLLARAGVVLVGRL